MLLDTYAEDLQRQLAVAAAAGGDEARAVAERLVAPLDSAVRLTLLQALSDAADEITRELAPGSVELRLRAGDPEFVVTATPEDEPVAPVPAPAEFDEGSTARINLRLPEQLKAAIEQAAARERLSVNAWLVRALGIAVANDPHDRPRGGRIGQEYKGWVR
jgi:hypothetical protein